MIHPDMTYEVDLGLKTNYLLTFSFKDVRYFLLTARFTIR